MTYDEIIEQLEITKSKIKEIARNEYGGESWNDDLDALTEAADIVADYSKATAQASEMSQKYEQPAMAPGKEEPLQSDRHRGLLEMGREKQEPARLFEIREIRARSRTRLGGCEAQGGL